jgi:hypothetical protein
MLTPWSRVLPEKLTGFELVKKFPAFYGTRRFITAFNFALKYTIKRVQVNQDGLKLNGTHQRLVYADDNVLGVNVHTLKENAEAGWLEWTRSKC